VARASGDLFVNYTRRPSTDNRSSSRRARYLLQGLLVRAQCGYAYYGKLISPSAAKGNPRQYAYYRCIGTNAYRFGGERVCDNLQLRTDRLDPAVWEEVCALLQELKRLEQEYQRRLQATSNDQDALTLLQAQSTKLRQCIGRLIDTYTEGLIDKQEFEPRLSRRCNAAADVPRRVLCRQPRDRSQRTP
jgi:site-specific DNA recombinase